MNNHLAREVVPMALCLNAYSITFCENASMSLLLVHDLMAASCARMWRTGPREGSFSANPLSCKSSFRQASLRGPGYPLVAYGEKKISVANRLRRSRFNRISLFISSTQPARMMISLRAKRSCVMQCIISPIASTVRISPKR